MPTGRTPSRRRAALGLFAVLVAAAWVLLANGPVGPRPRADESALSAPPPGSPRRDSARPLPAKSAGASATSAPSGPANPGSLTPTGSGPVPGRPSPDGLSQPPVALIVAPAAPLPQAFGSMRGAPGVATPLPAGEVALTFDDGPDPRWTPAILAVLARYRAHATFFDIGIHAAAYPHLVRAQYAQGNGVGNHTWTHPDLTTLSPAGVQSQLDLTNAVLATETGVRPSCVRPPYDAIDPLVRRMVEHRHLAMMLYDVDPMDWTLPGAAQIAARVLAAVHAGAVVDMHDGGGDRSETVAALPVILQGLAARHLTPVAICR